MAGRVQLSRKVGHSLLSNFRNEKPKAGMNIAVKEPENVEALPISSEDEAQDSSSDQPHVDSSDDDIAGGNIKRTQFKRKSECTPAVASGTANGHTSTAKERDSAGLAASTSERRSTRQIGAKKRTKEYIEDDDADEHDLFTSKKTKTTSDGLAGEVGDHMSSEKLLLTKPTVQRGYGKKSQNPIPQAKLKMKRYASDLTSPEKQPTLRASKYAPIDSSPVAHSKLSQPFKPENGECSPYSDGPSSEGKSDPPRALDGRNKKQKPTRRPEKKGKNKAIELSPEPMSQKPKFRMPDGYSNYAPSAELVDLGVTLDDASVEQKRQLDPGMALCPMCDEKIDEKLLKEFSNGERMKLVRQVKFCRLHKKISAQKTWEEKGYPVIDWHSLQARIEGHHDFLKSIIMGTESHFGDLLEKNISTGQSRTLFTTKEYLTPGYYGLRGMSVMTEAITDTFANLLRRRAPVDTRISGRGYTGFVQAVLVPELAVKLIQEDLALQEDQAREVMEESRVVGDILNDERRHSQSKALIQMPEGSQEAENKDAQEENAGRSDEITSVRLEIEQAANGVSDLPSPPSDSRRPTSVEAQSPEADDSDSNESLESLGAAIQGKRDLASVKKQDVTTLPSRVSPSNRKIKATAPIMMEVEDSDDLSSLDSI